MIQVHLGSSGVSSGPFVEDIDDAITTVAGCSLGFVLPGQPPHVLTVDPGTPTALQGVQADDVLMGIDGRDTRTLAKAEARMLLRTARSLDFKKGSARGPVPPPPGLNGGCSAAAGGGTPSLAGLALGLAMPKAAAAVQVTLQDPPSSESAGGSPAVGALPKAAPGELPAKEAVAAMSAKAPPPLAAALGFFEGANHALLQDGSCAAGSYQKAPLSMASLPRGKGPFDKGCKGDKGVGKGRPVFAALPGVQPMPPGLGGKGGKPTFWLPALPGFGLAGAKVGGPRIVLPPALTSNAALPPDPGEQPETLPADGDREAWLELLRDAFGQQFRCENDWQEPPPFHRALHFASTPGEPCQSGKFPREALNLQLQLLFKVRTGMGSEFDGPGVAPPITKPHGF